MRIFEYFMGRMNSPLAFTAPFKPLNSPTTPTCIEASHVAVSHCASSTHFSFLSTKPYFVPSALRLAWSICALAVRQNIASITEKRCLIVFITLINLVVNQSSQFNIKVLRQCSYNLCMVLIDCIEFLSCREHALSLTYLSHCIAD